MALIKCPDCGKDISTLAKNCPSCGRPMKNNEEWKKEWQDMPEFEMEDLSSFRKIVVHFRNQEDIDKFAELIGQKITKAPSLWYPEWKKRRYADKRYVDES